MKKCILFIYLFILNGLVITDSSSCDCCDQCFKPQQSTCPEIKYIENGLSGASGLSRYWNCCKPSCASKAEADKGNQSRLCDLEMNRIFDYTTKSKCAGGTGTACFSQVPFVIDGCDDIGFGFGTIGSSDPNICGRCFLLEFTGEGVWTTKDTHRALKNKKLIFMGINRGYSDDTHLGFNLLVPGGGGGNYPNACEGIFSGDLGAKWGGLLADCQGEAGMTDDIKSNTERRKCLIRKCTESFTGLPREGCLFYAYFLETAGNPKITYKEIECPQILKDKY